MRDPWHQGFECAVLDAALTRRQPGSDPLSACNLPSVPGARHARRSVGSKPYAVRCPSVHHPMWAWLTRIPAGGCIMLPLTALP